MSTSFHNTTLSNGLEIVAEMNDDALSVAAGFFVKTGSRDESGEVAGVSHFLEHMVFKGTDQRDALAVNRDLDRIGAKHNAQTSEEETIYHLTCLPEYLPRAFEILSDILRPSLRDNDFETEKQVILEEIDMYQDNPMSVAYEHAKGAHFGTHPLAHSVLGTRDSIGELRVEQMRNYYERCYGPSNIVLAVAGNARWDDVQALAHQWCGAWSGPHISRVAAAAKGRHEFHALARPDDLQQSIVTISDAPAIERDERYAAAILATILGDHTASRLYWELIDPGYADGAESSYQGFNMAGAFFTFLSCGPDVAQSNLTRVRNLAERLQCEGPTEAELTRARNKVMARTVMRAERPFSRLMSLGYQWTYRREYLSTDIELERIAGVTLDHLRRVLVDFPLWPMTIVSVGPNAELAAP